MTDKQTMTVERDHHQKAFERYYALGEKRSFARLAQEMDVSVASLKVWSRKFGWQQRVHEREATIARQVADQSIQATADEMSRNKRIVQMALVRLARAIANGQVRMQLGDLDRLIRLQSFLDGYTEGTTWDQMAPEELAQRLDWAITNLPCEGFNRFRAEFQRLEDARNHRLATGERLNPPPEDALFRQSLAPPPGIPE